MRADVRSAPRGQRVPKEVDAAVGILPLELFPVNVEVDRLVFRCGAVAGGVGHGIQLLAEPALVDL